MSKKNISDDVLKEASHYIEERIEYLTDNMSNKDIVEHLTKFNKIVDNYFPDKANEVTELSINLIEKLKLK